MYIILFIYKILYAQTERWVYGYNGQGHCSDRARFVVLGTDRNIYLTGESGDDITVLSLTPDGMERWIYHYGEPGKIDKVYSIIYGNDGNIYIAGSAEITGTQKKDIIVISLTSEGAERWVYSYNGPGNENDEAFSIVHGGDGNVYVAGKSNDSSDVFTVISLTSSGNFRWIYKYDEDTLLNSTGNEANSIIYGNDGNIYVAGKNSFRRTGADFTVVSLTSGGTERWRYRYNGPDSLSDEALSLIYGEDGNIYSTGYTQKPGNAGGRDICVISLTSEGTERWIYTYNGIGNSTDESYSIYYGTDGNIYLTGESNSNNRDIIAISLDNLGNERWLYRYNGPGDGEDKGHSILYGTDGNIYIAGVSEGNGTYDDFTVISLNSQGNERWVYRRSGSAYYNYDRAYDLVYGLNGNIYAVGKISEATDDFLIVSLTTNGIEEWVHLYNRMMNGNDKASKITRGMDGNIYGIGSTSGINGDLLILSVDSYGNERWVYTYNGSSNYVDFGVSIAYGNDGNIYATGVTENHESGKDILVLSLDIIGQERWTYIYGDTLEDVVTSFIYGDDGNIYAAGYSGEDLIAISINSFGVERWIYTYNGTGDYYDRAWDIVYGADGNIYVAGESYGWGSSSDFIVISLDTSGQENWVYRYNGVGNGTDYVNSITYGDDGNIYVAGYSWGDGTNGDFTVVSLSPSGNERWVYRYDGPIHGADYSNCIIYGTDGNIYAVGTSRGTNNSYDILVISLDNRGNERWVYRYDGEENGYDEGGAICFGADGNVYISGETWGGNDKNFDLIVISLTSSGDLRWIYLKNGSQNGNDGASSIFYGNDGYLYVGGNLYNTETFYDFTIVCLNPEIYIKEKVSSPLYPFSLPTIQSDGILRLSVFSSSNKIRFSIFNVLGQRILSKDFKIKENKMEYKILVPSGIYFVEIELDNKKYRRKICVLK